MNSKTSREKGWVAVSRRVIYGDTDAMGIVYYANYLRFFEMGRNELLRINGGTVADLEEKAIHMPVIEVGARYHMPARYDDEVQIAACIERVEHVRVRFAYRLTHLADETLLVEGFTIHACINAETGRATRLPKELKRRFEACLVQT